MTNEQEEWGPGLSTFLYSKPLGGFITEFSMKSCLLDLILNSTSQNTKLKNCTLWSTLTFQGLSSCDISWVTLHCRGTMAPVAWVVYQYEKNATDRPWWAHNKSLANARPSKTPKRTGKEIRTGTHRYILCKFRIRSAPICKNKCTTQYIRSALPAVPTSGSRYDEKLQRSVFLFGRYEDPIPKPKCSMSLHF
jgi:hypothetical protein